jgi:hypothetical protein
MEIEPPTQKMKTMIVMSVRLSCENRTSTGAVSHRHAGYAGLGTAWYVPLTTSVLPSWTTLWYSPEGRMIVRMPYISMRAKMMPAESRKAFLPIFIALCWGGLG